MGTMAGRHGPRLSPCLGFRFGLGDSQTMSALSEIGWALSCLYMCLSHFWHRVLSALCVFPCIWYWVSLVLHTGILGFVDSICFQKALSVSLSLGSIYCHVWLLFFWVLFTWSSYFVQNDVMYFVLGKVRGRVSNFASGIKLFPSFSQVLRCPWGQALAYSNNMSRNAATSWGRRFK